MNQLANFRAHIDEIDQQMVDLFIARMQIAEGIVRYKKDNSIPVLDAGRERQLLAKVADQAGEDFANYTESLYRTILATSRSYQNMKLGAPSTTYTTIQRALEATPNLFPQRAVVACQGIEGAYSQIATDSLFKSPSIFYFASFEQVFKAVEMGMCQYGILPIENSTAGSVNSTYDQMVAHNFSIVRATRLKISHNLLTQHGVKKEEIREVFSHEQALNQCSDYLAEMKDVKITVVANTAIAAKMVADSDRRDVAALSSRFCGEQYGLNILESNVQDKDNNYTRFICISKKPEIYPGADRTSLMLTLPHKPGALHHVLSKFYTHGVNLLKLESRPVPNREFEFMFYFDVECSIYAPEMENLFRDLECECDEFRYLGSYQEVIGS